MPRPRNRMSHPGTERCRHRTAHRSLPAPAPPRASAAPCASLATLSCCQPPPPLVERLDIGRLRLLWQLDRWEIDVLVAEAHLGRDRDAQLVLSLAQLG